jgi:hypothetical protein
MFTHRSALRAIAPALAGATVALAANTAATASPMDAPVRRPAVVAKGCQDRHAPASHVTTRRPLRPGTGGRL